VWGGSERKLVGCKLVDDNGDGPSVQSVLQAGTGGGVTSGKVTDDSETLLLDNLESEVLGGACGVPETAYKIHYNCIKFEGYNSKG
jgi:hypothetical protein